MNEMTLQAVNEFFITWDKIKKGELLEIDLNPLFEKLSKYDYRSKYEQKIDYYCEAFQSGAYVTRLEDSRSTDGIPKKKEYQDIELYCKEFLKEHYVHVQLPFWKKYKEEIYMDVISIKPKEIFETIKRIKADGKRSKNKD